jgi:hypothetical protein
MKIDVEISQNRRVGNNRYVPALIGLLIAVPTGSKGPNGKLPPEVRIFVDLTEAQARKLAKELVCCAEIVAEGRAYGG